MKRCIVLLMIGCALVALTSCQSNRPSVPVRETIKVTVNFDDVTNCPSVVPAGGLACPTGAPTGALCVHANEEPDKLIAWEKGTGNSAADFTIRFRNKSKACVTDASDTPKQCKLKAKRNYHYGDSDYLVFKYDVLGNMNCNLDPLIIVMK